MTLLCIIGRISSPTLKAQSLKNLGNLLLKPSSTVYINRLSYHDNLTLTKHQRKELFDPHKYARQSASLVSIARQFSTSSARLSDHKGHDHSKIWTLERLLSVLLLPLVPVALYYPCQQLDTALALLVVLHTHFGLEAIVVDYIRPILFGNLAPKIGLALLYLFSAITFAGLLNLIYNDTGLANAIITVWRK